MNPQTLQRSEDVSWLHAVRSRLSHLVFGFAALLVATGGAGFAAERCERAISHNNRLGAELTDARVLSAAASVIETSEFKPKVVFCELHMPYINATVDNLEHFYAIGLTKTLIERTTDAELRAIIAHELAHVVLGHRTPIFEVTRHRKTKYEKAADELATRWSGQEPMISVLKKLLDDVTRLQSAMLRDRATAELEARIKALQLQRGVRPY